MPGKALAFSHRCGSKEVLQTTSSIYRIGMGYGTHLFLIFIKTKNVMRAKEIDKKVIMSENVFDYVFAIEIVCSAF
jgi:hypothetical protein